MNPLVMLSVVKRELRVDHTDEDARLTLLIDVASQKTRDYLKDQFSVVVPNDLDPPPVIQLATVALVRAYYDGWPMGSELPAEFVALLHSYRDPALR